MTMAAGGAACCLRNPPSMQAGYQIMPCSSSQWNQQSELVSAKIFAIAESASLVSAVQCKTGFRMRKGHQLRCARSAILQDKEAPVSAASEAAKLPPLVARVEKLFASVAAGTDARKRIQFLLDQAARLPRLPEHERTAENRVMGCTAQVWLTAAIDSEGAVHFGADSDAELTRGFCAVLLEALNGASAEDVLALSPDALSGLGLGAGGASSRVNTWYNVLITIQKRTGILLAQREGRPAFEPFPSLIITAEELNPQGSFAVAQAKYLLPDASKVQMLAEHLIRKRIGIVAHFYMDPEVQGVLVAAQKFWPHIHISDSLMMADRAVKMAEAGCESVAVLGVDFMSENARAILDQAGYDKVRVYRMSNERIGCSLAEAAETPAYLQYLQDATKNTPALHVIYINTSLETKARAQALVPTITCTSSNVVQTVLQAFAEVPDLTVWYGPDSYMGANLAELFVKMADMEDEDIATVHPLHNRRTIASLLPRLHYYNDGSCIVHDMFGKDVVARVRQGYGDAFQTAHFEVPGEMFALAMEAKQRGMGTVGSTQNILDFIKLRVQEAVQRDFEDRLQFVLGTESGMITAIVGAVQNVLKTGRSAGMRANVEVEIVFPVSSDAVSTSQATPANSEKGLNFAELSVVPGVSSGEGCSMHGGCASCPYMKMNSLDALLRVCELIKTPMESLLAGHQVRNFKTQVSGRSVAELGCVPILHMRHFQSTGKLPEELKQHISNQGAQG